MRDLSFHQGMLANPSLGDDDRSLLVNNAAVFGDAIAGPQASSKIAKPPASAMAYWTWIERQRARPAGPRHTGGSGRTATGPETRASGGFLTMEPRFPLGFYPFSHEIPPVAP